MSVTTEVAPEQPGRRTRDDARPRLVVAVLGVAVVGAVVASLFLGDYPASVGEVLSAAVGAPQNAGDAFVITGKRLPRALVAVVVGVALGWSGALFQSVIRNPLGSPDIIGFTSGASLGAVVAITSVGSGIVTMAIGGAVGGVATMVLVLGLATVLVRRSGIGQVHALVILGIAAHAAFNGGVWFLLSRVDISTAMTSEVWLSGSLQARSWQHVLLVLLVLVAATPGLVLLQHHLGVLEVGAELAHGLGARVARIRAAGFGVGTLLAATAVAAAGPIAFVALSAPHIARRLTARPGLNLVASGLVGALVLTTSDQIAQWTLPAPVPTGTVTALVGGLYLVWLLRWGRSTRL